MTKSKKKLAEDVSDIEQPDIASVHGKILLSVIERQLRCWGEGQPYIPPKQIARALRKGNGIPIPPIINEYLCDLLEDKIKAPAGRPKAAQASTLDQIKRNLIPIYYTRYLTWLRKRKRTAGLEGWKVLQATDWWKGPPSERAARMTVRSLGLHMNWNRVHNIVSETQPKNQNVRKLAR